jgi:hypothetical protein
MSMSCSSYICKTVYAGNVIEKQKYFAPRGPGVKLARGKNISATSEEQWVVNEKRSIQNLYYLILVNFGKEDIRLDLTYRNPAPSPEQAKILFDKFVRKVRDLYKKSGHTLKWIATTEHDGHRIHHHVLLNNIGLTRKDYNALWDHAELSYKAFRYYDGGVEDAQRLSKYLVKETRETFCRKDAIQKRRWRSSRNLKKPIIKKEVIHCKGWTDKPKPKKGYYVQTVQFGYTAFGYPFQFYRMIREDEEGEPYQKKRRTIPGTERTA